MLFHMLKLTAVAMRIVNYLTSGDFIIVTIIIEIWQYLLELRPKPTQVEIDVALPIEHRSAVEVGFGVVSFGALEGSCAVQAAP